MNRFALCMVFAMLSLSLFAQEKTYDLEKFTHGLTINSALNIDRAPAFPFGFSYNPGVGIGMGYQMERRVGTQFSWTINPHLQYSQNKLTINSFKHPGVRFISFDPKEVQLGVLEYRSASINLPYMLNFYAASQPLHFILGLSLDFHFAVNNDWTYDLIEINLERPDEFKVLGTDLEDDFVSRPGALNFMFGGGYNTRKWNFDLLFKLGAKSFVDRLGYSQIIISLVANYKL